MKYKIPEGFKLGGTIPAWQYEGEFGKDEDHHHFPHLMYVNSHERWNEGRGMIRASEGYTRYKEDIPLLDAVGTQQLRFNIDWSRFIKDYETNEVDEEVSAHYDDVINRLIAQGIEPILCIEHWELPAYYYEKYDGYASKKVVDHFVAYATELFKRYGDRVKQFYTFNEPIVIPQLCFLDGEWWPYVSDAKRAMNWMHGKILASAKAIQAYRELNMDGKIGIIVNPALIYHRSDDNPADVKARDRADSFYWGMFVDTAIKGEYPPLLMQLLEEENAMFEHDQEELDIIKNNTIDILGLNYYQPKRIKAPEVEWNKETPFNFKKYFSAWDFAGKRMNTHRGWEIYPKALYDVAMRIKHEYGNIEWVVAESGMGVSNEHIYKDENGVIQDDYRIDYIKEHLAWLFKAIEEGANCKGYWLFASIDNCSPYNAYKNRYGLIEVDLEQDRNRRIKKSGHFYKQMVEDQSFEFDELETTFDPTK